MSDDTATYCRKKAARHYALREMYRGQGNQTLAAFEAGKATACHEVAKRTRAKERRDAARVRG